MTTETKLLALASGIGLAFILAALYKFKTWADFRKDVDWTDERNIENPELLENP